MKAFKVFVFGFLYGLLFKFAFDRIYRGNEMEDLRHENASLQEYIRTLESRFQARSQESKSVAPSAIAPSTPQPAQVTSEPTTFQPAQTETAQPAQSISEKDDLKAIKGIGPAIEKKLNGAGVYTFEALSRLSVAELETILGKARRLAQEGDLISQAKQLARKKRT